MALTADVVVVGGGMAGVCASLAAREKGAKVLLVARASGATALSSGAIDFGGAVADATVGEGARAVSRQPGHPYALLGDALPALLERTMAFLRRHLVSLGLEGARVAADKCLWLPTPVGTARPAALVQSSIAGADLRNLSSRPARLDSSQDQQCRRPPTRPRERKRWATWVLGVPHCHSRVRPGDLDTTFGSATASTFTKLTVHPPKPPPVIRAPNTPVCADASSTMVSSSRQLTA